MVERHGINKHCNSRLRLSILCSQVLCRFWGFCWESGRLQLEWSYFPGLKTSNSRPQMCTGSMVYLATLQVPHVISEGWVESIGKPNIQPFHTHTHTCPWLRRHQPSHSLRKYGAVGPIVYPLSDMVRCHFSTQGLDFRSSAAPHIYI